MWILDKLLGSDNVIQAGIDGIDKAIHTDEEKSDAKRAFLKLYEPFKVAQRYLSVIFGVPYALAWFITFVASFFLESIDQQLALLTGDMGKIVLSIIAFYFLGGAGEGIVARFNGKK